MKLQLHIEAAEDGDPQNPLAACDLERITDVFEQELLSIYPDAARYDEVEFSIVFVGAEEMRHVNMDYRNVDAPTDVLAFPLWDNEGRFEPELVLDALLPLGDVMICPEETARIHSAHPFPEALALVMAHGFLHLLAWDHDTPEKEEEMWRRQELIRSKLLEAMPAAGGGL